MQLQVFTSLAELDGRAWDRLLTEDATPFVRHAWLAALEESGCASPRAGWRPSHLTLWRGKELIAAAPAYLKEGSDGDFSRDWGWAEGAERAGIPYYPKLLITVPFTPVTGRRFLIAPGEDRSVCMAALVEGAGAFAKQAGAHSIQVLFPLADEADALAELGLARRVAFQYHWRNHGYADPDGFLACFNSKRRNQARRERAAPAQQGISIRTVRGPELAKDALAWGRRAYELHRSTVDKLMWGRRWLNRPFYEQLFSTMPEPLEVVVAERAGAVVAGAFNVASATHLYGRYWGCHEEHPFLHFNVCLYHSIDDCIRRGLQVFEGGAGGEHKIGRGFEPAETYSSQLFFDARLDQAVRSYVAGEAAERERALERWHAESPILRRRPPLREDLPT